MRIVYVFLAATQDTLLSGLIALTERVLYPYYHEEVPRLWGLTPLDDQAWAGAVMWGTGSMMYMITILVLVAKMLEDEEQGHAYKKAEKFEFRLASGGD